LITGYITGGVKTGALRSGSMKNKLDLIITEPTEGYCLKCQTKKEIKNARFITMENGSQATEGICATCGSKIFKISKT